VDSHVSYLPAEVIAEDSIGRGVGSAGLGRRNNLPQLLSCPLCGWMVGHAEVDNASAVMGQYQKHVKNLEADSGDSEEVDRNHLGEVVLEEGAPGLKWRLAAAHHVLANAGLTDVDAERATHRGSGAHPKWGFRGTSWGSSRGLRGK